jgi:hypothetical protein
MKRIYDWDSYLEEDTSGRAVLVIAGILNGKKTIIKPVSEVIPVPPGFCVMTEKGDMQYLLQYTQYCPQDLYYGKLGERKKEIQTRLYHQLISNQIKCMIAIMHEGMYGLNKSFESSETIADWQHRYGLEGNSCGYLKYLFDLRSAAVENDRIRWSSHDVKTNNVEDNAVVLMLNEATDKFYYSMYLTVDEDDYRDGYDYANLRIEENKLSSVVAMGEWETDLIVQITIQYCITGDCRIELLNAFRKLFYDSKNKSRKIRASHSQSLLERLSYNFYIGNSGRETLTIVFGKEEKTLKTGEFLKYDFRTFREAEV